MGRIFLTVLNMSLTASYVIIVVIIVRLMLKRAPKVVSYALWSVVAFRLAIPFSFESVFSLIPRANNAFRLSADAIYRQNYSIDNMMGRVGNYVNHSVHLTSPETAANRLAILTETAAYIWFSGIIALLAIFFGRSCGDSGNRASGESETGGCI
ncbi:M56 family metallopeptidase [Thermoclostridium stercorarium]|jgi:beta-lactamase regulating signal transducer with metallopeptidase domain|uniref:M56 family metallopeptidase n=1 Tax=Thermoclostridium stercorarium TaxID=1510 RepID=UPI0009F303A4|nr:M56 family metallopeptidase [Thermoclostridium stercorarium]UZQ86700.1 M56 family metallopeptidase [Thermoclostridium stercorarium]